MSPFRVYVPDFGLLVPDYIEILICPELIALSPTSSPSPFPTETYSVQVDLGLSAFAEEGSEPRFVGIDGVNFKLRRAYAIIPSCMVL